MLWMVTRMRKAPHKSQFMHLTLLGLDLCIPSLSGCPKNSIKKSLFDPRVLMRTKKRAYFAHTGFIVPVKYRIGFKILLDTHKVLNNQPHLILKTS